MTTDIGLQRLATLVSLIRLALHYCDRITDAGTSYIGVLVGLRDLDMHGSSRLTYFGHLDSLAYLKTLESYVCEQLQMQVFCA